MTKMQEKDIATGGTTAGAAPGSGWELPADDATGNLPEGYSFGDIQVLMPAGKVELTAKYKRKVFSAYYNPDILVYNLRLLGRFHALGRAELAEEGSYALSHRAPSLPLVSLEEMNVAIDHLNRKGFIYLVNSPGYGECCVAAYRLTSREMSRFDSDVQLAGETRRLGSAPGGAASKLALGMLHQDLFSDEDVEMMDFPEVLADTDTFVEKIDYGDSLDLIIGSFAVGGEPQLQKKISRLLAGVPKISRLVLCSAERSYAEELAQKYLPAFPGSSCYVYSLQEQKYYSYPGGQPRESLWNEPAAASSAAPRGWKQQGRGWKRSRPGWR